MIKFVVFSMTRTGSSMLTERLSTHPEVACFGAIFSATGWYNVDKPNEGGVLGRLRERMNPRWIDTTLRIEDRDQLMAELFNVNNDMMAVGFKHHLSGDRKVTESLLGSDMRKIFLSRTNHLATYSSEKVVRVTGQGAARRNVRVIAAKCVFEPKGFDAFRQRRDQINRRAREAMKGTILDIEYNEARTDAGMERIAEFLGVDPHGIGAAPTLKRNSDSIVDRFENPEAVLEHLRKNGLEHFALEAPTRELRELNICIWHS